MNILFISNQVKTYNKGFQNDFEPLLGLNHNIFWAANFSSFIGDFSTIPATLINIPVSSNPFNLSNRKAYKTLLKEAINKDISYIVCSTPIGGLIGRLIAKRLKIKVMYAAHGLLFFKGAPLINNTLYKAVEKVLIRYTDVIITINDEDFKAMEKMKKKKSKLYLVHGAGVDIDANSIIHISTEKKKDLLSVPKESHLITSIGFLNKNKNYSIVIKALALLKNETNIHYVICGEGKEKSRLQKLATKLGIGDRVHLLGYRTDVFEIIKSSDAVVVPSFREGVPRVLLEAMNLGIPCIGSDTRGIRELIGYEFSRFLCNPRSDQSFADSIKYVLSNDDYCKRSIERNIVEAKKYTSTVVRKELYDIYLEQFGKAVSK